ncbi:hypothetical protein X942_5912 [Burkholderia pseudomallei MSHR5596]|nr:hypothetical protein X942_5912 [Burkholderia pseudomallei MSHR5596]
MTAPFIRVECRLANRYAWWDRTAPNTLTTRASNVSTPARMSTGSVASQIASIRINAAILAATAHNRSRPTGASVP